MQTSAPLVAPLFTIHHSILPCPCPVLQPSLTEGMLAQLGRTPQGGGSYRPYNHPPSPSPPEASPIASVASISSGLQTAASPIPKVTPTSLLGCAVTSATVAPRACSCKGMLAPRRFSGGSNLHICYEPNCPHHFAPINSHFYQCLNCLNILCTKCRASKPKRLGKLPNDYLVAKLRTTATGEPIPITAPSKPARPKATPNRKNQIFGHGLPAPRPSGSSDDPVPLLPSSAAVQGSPPLGASLADRSSSSTVNNANNSSPTGNAQRAPSPSPPRARSPAPSALSPAPGPNVGRLRRGAATTVSGTPLQTDDGRSTQQSSLHHYFQTKVASGLAFMAMVTQGFLAQPPMQNFVTEPAAIDTSLAPPSLTMICSNSLPADMGELASPSISPFSLSVLSQLRALPTYDSLTTLTYCPKGSARRFGILYASAFWYQNVAMDCSTQHQ